MRPKHASSGYGFLGAVAYITHDAGEKTAERVGWSATLNTMHDDPTKAAQEMWRTWNERELIKQKAGVSNRGRKAELPPCMHFYISFHPDDREKLTPELLREAANGLLKVYGLEGHQAVLATHDDTNAPHLHIVASTVDQDTGKVSNVKAPQYKLSRWAQKFEQEHGLKINEKRRDNNKRRDDGEVVKFDYEQDDHEKLKKAARQREEKKLQQRAEQQPNREEVWQQMRALHGEDRRELTNAQKVERDAMYARQRAEMGVLFGKAMKKAHADIAREVEAMRETMTAGQKEKHRKTWAAQFKKEREELKAFDTMGALTRAGYYIKRMNDGSKPTISGGVLRTVFEEKKHSRPDWKQVGFKEGLLRAFFNDPVVMTTLREDLKEQHDQQRREISSAIYKPVRDAVAKAWEAAPERLAEVYEALRTQQIQHEGIEHKRAVHLYERGLQKEQHAQQWDELQEHQRGEYAAVFGNWRQGPQRADAFRRADPPATDRATPTDAPEARSDAPRRSDPPAPQRDQQEPPAPTRAAPATQRRADPPAPDRRNVDAPADRNPPAPTQERRQQPPQTQQRPAAAAVEQQQRTPAQALAAAAQRAAQQRQEERHSAALLKDAKTREDTAKAQEAEAKQRADNTPASMAYTLAQRFQRNAAQRQTAQEKQKENNRSERGLKGKFERERDR